MPKRKSSHIRNECAEASVLDCVGLTTRRQCRAKDPPGAVRALLEETYDVVYSVSEFIQEFVLPALSHSQQESLLKKLDPFLAASNRLKKAKLIGLCDSLHVPIAAFQQLQILFQETLITLIQRSPPPLTKVRQPVVPPSQSLVSLVNDIVWTMLQQQTKTVPDRSVHHSRSHIKYIICQGFTTGNPTATSTSLKVQKQINSAMEYCSTSFFFRVLHNTLLGDDILRYLLLNFNIFIPILPNDDLFQKNDAMICDANPSGMCASNQSPKIFNYWQVSGLPFHYSSSTKGPPKKSAATNVTGSKSFIKQSRVASEDFSGPSSQAIVSAAETQITWTNSQSVIPAESLDAEITANRKNSRRKKRRRPIASLNSIFETSESGPPHSLSPKACLCRKALFYSNSYTSAVGKQDLFMMPSSSDPPTSSVVMTPGQLWDSMSMEWTDFLRSQSISPLQKRTPPPILDLCTDILHRHSKKTDYHRLLQQHCPLPAILFEPSDATSLSDLANQHASPEGVIGFVQACLYSVFPSTFWDGIACRSSQKKIASETERIQLTNEFIFLRQIVPMFVTLRRNERMGNKMLLQNIRVQKLNWMNSDQEERHKVGASRLHHEHRKLQVLSIFRWLFHGYVIPLLQQCFYVTESEMHGKRVLYYRKPVWALFRTLSMSKLLGPSTKKVSYEKKEETDGTCIAASKVRKMQYVEVTEADVLRRLLREEQQMGVCRLRLVPKATGVRPIATLNKREFITPVVPTSILAVKPKQNTLSDILDIGEGVLNDEEELDTPLGLARKKTRRDVVTGTVLSSALSDLQSSFPPTRIRLSNQSRASTNTMLSDIFSVLTFERDRKEHSFGSGLTGMHDFYPRYRSFLQHWKNTTGKDSYPRQQLYFGSVDIRHCYDNIDQEHLLTVIDRTILTEDHYVIQKYSLYKPERHSDCALTVKWQSKKDVSLLDKLEPFGSKVRVLSHEQRGTLFVDGVNTIVVNKEQIMNQLRAHLTGHMVVTKGRFGNRYLLQSTGIPQGSILSTILCNFYYGEIEGRLFDKAHDYDRSSSPIPSPHADTRGARLMVRMVDDFFLVTTNVDDLRRFFVTMHQGDATLGVTINEEKTSSSIPMTIFLDDDTSEKKSTDSVYIQSSNHADLSGSNFSWCGMMFDKWTGEVRIDYSRFVDGRGGDSLTVDRVSHEGDHLFLQMKQFVRPRCLPILYDPLINNMQGCIVNFYQMMVYTAVKTSEYLKALQSECYPSSSLKTQNVVLSNISFIIKCIGDTIQFGPELIQSRIRSALKNQEASDSPTDSTTPNEPTGTALFLPTALATWLGWRSFYDVFQVTNEFRSFAETELSHRAHNLQYDHRMYPFNVEATVQKALKGMDLANLLSSQHQCR